ncbi:MAG: carboxylating nicotinate-nucleotide diphosphorylase [bacterium]
MGTMKLPRIEDNVQVKSSIWNALAEDIGAGDATTDALATSSAKTTAQIVSRGSYVVSGSTIGRAVFQRICPELKVRILIPDGKKVKRNGTIMTISGPAGAILSAERTALNFMQRMTGIATLTASFVTKTRRFGTVILDTRKTTPGLRPLEKYAVLCGGGTNHRMGLDDMVLIKDNHRALWNQTQAGDLGMAVMKARMRNPELAIEIEVENEKELLSALHGQPECVLLDNMKPQLMRKCVLLCSGKCYTEASGGITLENVEEVARTGVDSISLGCLTHSAPAADLSLELK